ncbi:MAG: hypothetical protein HY673_11405 [Chloroflexi bacterium]|nr:hypothetical protein [Chloroflexota bacterium]
MESKCHKVVKEVLCGGKDGTEHKLPSGRGIDCRASPLRQCYEVELNRAKLKDAVTRLVEGIGGGSCSNATLVTKDSLVSEAQKLASTIKVNVMPISRVPGVKRFI